MMWVLGLAILVVAGSALSLPQVATGGHVQKRSVLDDDYYPVHEKECPAVFETEGRNIVASTDCTEYYCTYEIQCLPGMRWDFHSEHRNIDDIHKYICTEDGKYTEYINDLPGNTYDIIIEKCIRDIPDDPVTAPSTEVASSNSAQCDPNPILPGVEVFMVANEGGPELFYNLKCRFGFTWDELSFSQNPAPAHLYSCKDGVYTDDVTNIKYDSLLESCVIVDAPVEVPKCDKDPKLSGTETKINCMADSAICTYEIKCKVAALNWNPNAEQRNPAKIHYYFCQDGVYTDVVTSTDYDSLVESCGFIAPEVQTPVTEQAPIEKGLCLEELSVYTAETTVRCDDTGICMYSVKCLFDLQFLPEANPNPNRVHSYLCKNGIYMDVDTNVTYTAVPDQCVFIDYPTEPVDPVPNGLCLDLIDMPGRAVNITCSKERDCNYEIKCEEGFEWSEDSKELNEEEIHLYNCKNGKYTDTLTKKTYTKLIEHCEPIRYEPIERDDCVRELSIHTADTSVQCGEFNGVCVYTVKCLFGTRFLPEANPNPNRIHSYACKDGIYMDVDTNVTYIEVPDQCLFIDHIQEPVWDPACVRYIHEMPGRDLNISCTDNKNCNYEIKCKKGFTWSAASLDRNEEKTHLYTCKNGGNFTEFHTKKTYEDLTEHCEPIREVPIEREECVKNLSIHQMDTTTNCESGICSYTVRCMTGLRFLPDANPNPNSVHSYECRDGIYMDVETRRSYIAIPDRCIMYDASAPIDAVQNEPFYTTTTPAPTTSEVPCQDLTYTNIWQTMYYIHTCVARPLRNKTTCRTQIFCDPTDNKNVSEVTTELIYDYLQKCDPVTKAWTGFHKQIEEADPKKLLKLYCDIDDPEIIPPKPTQSTQPPTPSTTTTPVPYAGKDCHPVEKQANIGFIKRRCLKDQSKMCGVTFRCNALGAVHNISDLVYHSLECDRSQGLWKHKDTGKTYEKAEDICQTKSIPMKKAKKPSCVESLSLPNVKAEVNCSAGLCLYQLSCKPGFVWDQDSETTYEAKKFYACYGDNSYKEQKTKKKYQKIEESCKKAEPVEELLV